MSIWQIFLEALESLKANKLRSGLTALGIVIGVAAVVSMLAIGEGATNSITSQIEGIGSNLLFVNSGGDSSNPEPLTLDDAAAISNIIQVPSVAAVAPTLQGQAQVAVSGASTNSSVIGVTPEYFIVQNAEISEGQTITAEQNDNQDSVVLLGTEVAEELFGRTTNLVGESVRVNGQIFRVTGVLEEQGGSRFGSADNQILVPLSTAQVRLLRRDGIEEVDLIYVQATSAETVTAAVEEVSQILRTRHLSTLGEDDFSIQNTQSILDTASSITGTLTLFLGGVAGISLLVGGIGIMNIMLVSVIERTREIGLRKAMGARKATIQMQFLIESSLLSLGGGVTGILLGWAISSLVSGIPGPGGSTIEPVIGLNAVVLATTFSAAVGIFFGLYPASRAAKLEPVEALRSE